MGFLEGIGGLLKTMVIFVLFAFIILQLPYVVTMMTRQGTTLNEVFPTLFVIGLLVTIALSMGD